MMKPPPALVAGSVYHSAAASRQGQQHEQAAAPTVHQAAKKTASIQAAKKKKKESRRHVPAQCHFPLLGVCRVRRVCKRCLLIILFDTDSMDWIAAAEATLGTEKERKRERLLRTDTSREELPSPAHQKQKTVSRKKRQEKSRYRQRLLPESPGCQYTVREKLVFK